MKALSPQGVHPPFAAYSHGLIAPPGQLVAVSGQLGVKPDGSTPEGAEAQANVAFDTIDAILAEAGITRREVIRLNAYVTDRAHMAGYMAARDVWVGDMAPPPASTLMIVSGFTRPEFLVEIEVLAVAPA